MKLLGYSRMVFVGDNGSMGYEYGKEYALVFYQSNWFNRLFDVGDFWIKDINDVGQAVSYSNVVSFLMNWEASRSHL